MQRLPSRGHNGRPYPLQSAQSYSKTDSNSTAPLSRNRSSTLPSSSPELDSLDLITDHQHDEKTDVFEVRSEAGAEGDADANTSGHFPDSFEDLPIEIKSLMERCELNAVAI